MDIPSIGKIIFSNAIPLFNFKIGFQAWDELRETNMEANMFVSFLLDKLLLLLLLIGRMQANNGPILFFNSFTWLHIIVYFHFDYFEWHDLNGSTCFLLVLLFILIEVQFKVLFYASIQKHCLKYLLFFFNGLLKKPCFFFYHRKLLHRHFFCNCHDASLFKLCSYWSIVLLKPSPQYA